MTTPALAQICQLFELYGAKNYGESCSQVTHSISCAWHAQQDGAKSSLIVAAFLHDIGHFIADNQQLVGFNRYGHIDHAEIGANWLAQRGFPASVYQPIRYHVVAKRYLMTKLNSNELSHASSQTLIAQGGLLSSMDQKNFEKSECFNQAVKLRRYDDLGKPLKPITLTITPWLGLIDQVLTENNT
ncbi:MAG: putative HD phosphohydrolase [Paraglaciecola sp.]|jgi:predicted HD phosphohydrolase